MKITMTVVRLGSCYRKVIIGQTQSPFDGRFYPDAIYGATDEEIIERLRSRLPGFRLNLKQAGKKQKQEAKP